MKKILSILLSSLCLCALGARAEIEQATVTLPYSELLDLLKQVKSADKDLQEALPKPPVDVLVQSVVYSIDCSEPKAPTMEASFIVVNLSEAWQSVFLLEASEAIRSIDPPDTKLVQRDGGIHMLLEPKASGIVTLGLQTGSAGPAQGGRLVADFVAVGAAQSLLKVKHGGDPKALFVTGAVGANRDKTEFSLPAFGGPVQVKLYESEAIEPTRWNASAKHWIRDLGGVVEVRCNLRLSATDGGLTSKAKVLLPQSVSMGRVAGFGVGAGPDNSIEMTAQGILVHLQWPHDGAMQREVMLRYTLPIEMADGQFAVPLVKVADVVRMDSGSYVSEFDGMELKPLGERWAESGRLPKWIAQEAELERLHYVATHAGESLTLAARMLPRVKTASATVQQAEYQTRLVAEGGMLHQAEVTVEHQESAQYQVKLPEGGKLLSCSLNGRSTEPLLAEDGGLIFNLPKAGGVESTSRVGYVFTTSGAKMNPVEGKAQLELPRTLMFIHRLKWEVQLPKEYQATALEGNVVIDAGGAQGGAVRLSKQIYSDEAPAAALYYTRKNLQR